MGASGLMWLCGQGGMLAGREQAGASSPLPTHCHPTPALRCPAAACDFEAATCVIVKHTNPCGVASREDLLEAYRLAVIADPISAFGGIVAFNRWLLRRAGWWDVRVGSPS